MVETKLYTVAQVRDWLEHNHAPEGLTREVIRPAMAWAIIHHPDAKDDDPIIAAIFDNGILAASTCAIPEVMVKPYFPDQQGRQKRIWWFPMLWVKSEYRGKGYGLVAIGSLAEVYGEGCAWTAWAVQESIEIFEFLGCQTYYFPHYFLSDKHIKTNTFRGKLAMLKQRCLKWRNNRKKPALPHYDFTVRYLNNVDDESYDLICKHNLANYFLSSQKVLNWEVQYPWYISMPLTERLAKDGDFFQDITPSIQYSFIQVWHSNMLVGVYRLRHDSSSMTIDYLYYDNEYSNVVFASIVEHITQIGITSVDTEDEQLFHFIQKYLYFPKCHTERLSLSVAPSIKVPDNYVR